MKTVTILMLVWYTGLTAQPIVQFQEVDSMDTCRSMSIELSRMIEYTHSKYIEDNIPKGAFSNEPPKLKYKTFCHVKEIK